MRIRRIFVEGLFDTFNHDIPLNADDRITIIHAPNGFGKTTILRMIDALFNAKYQVLRNVPFRRFGVEFEGGDWVEVSHADTRPKKARGKYGEGRDLRIRHSNNSEFVFGGDDFVFRLARSGRLPANLVSEMEETLRGFETIGPNVFRSPDGRVLNLSDLTIDPEEVEVETFGTESLEPDWLRELRNSIGVRFIGTKRLEISRADESRKRSAAVRRHSAAVSAYAQQLAQQIRSTLTKYAELSQSLDRTFPHRLVDQRSAEGTTPAEVVRRLTELEARRQRLIEAGVLDPEEESHVDIPGTNGEKLDETKAGILAVYAADAEKKLSVFDELFTRINLFKSIIKRRFLHKRISINKDRGFVFATDAGKPLSPTDLSSGEQHELVIFYELLFKVRPDSLILIDEPEISLHVSWQMQFLRDLVDITELSQFDVLLATHSPEIIHDRWDLAVELKDTKELQEAGQ